MGTKNKMKIGVCSNCAKEGPVCSHCWHCEKCCDCEKLPGHKFGGMVDNSVGFQKSKKGSVK